MALNCAESLATMVRFFDFWNALFPVYAQFSVVGLVLRGIRKMIGMQEKPDAS